MYEVLGIAFLIAKKYHLYETERHISEGLSPDKEWAKFAKNALASRPIK
jgi:hypothetical protein